ncbi:MAG: ABC transporter permease [Desulfurococcales archaeon]|nr:ABC transporter permease [Desulfurococcales archaeon]
MRRGEGEVILSQVLSEVYAAAKSMVKARDILFWTIIFPIIVTGLMIGIFGRGSSSITFDIAIESHDSGWFNETVYSVLNATGVFNVRFVEHGLEELVSNGSVEVGLYIPQGVSENLSSGIRARVVVYYLTGVQDSEVAKANLEGILSGVSKNISAVGMKMASQFIPAGFMERIKFLADPVIIKDRVLQPGALATTGGIRAYYAVSIVGIQALYIGIFSSISMIVERRKEGVFPVILSSPVRGWVMFLSDTLATIVLVAISALVVLLAGLAMGADYSKLDPPKIAISFALIGLGAVSMIGIGLILSILAKTSEGAAALGNMVAFPIMFIGGFTVPKFILPEQLQIVAEWFPLSRIIDSIRNMVVFNYTITEAVNHAMPAIIIGLTIYTIGALIYKNVLTKIAETPY